jgi:hypothetical protein
VPVPVLAAQQVPVPSREEKNKKEQPLMIELSGCSFFHLVFDPYSPTGS